MAKAVAKPRARLTEEIDRSEPHPISQRRGSRLIVSGYGTGIDTPAGRDRCSGCRYGSWWRTSKRVGWVCATCRPPHDFDLRADGYETINLKLDWWETLDLVRDFPNAERMASKHIGQWMVDRHLESVPMVQWTVEQWQAFVHVMCRTYIEGVLVERRDVG